MISNANIGRPLISIIIPCHKAEKFIGNCLDMIAGQSYSNLEVIVIVDGDFDRTKEIVSQYENVKQIVNPVNLGPSAARNAGLAVATGEYVHFMDVDDEINPDFYLKMIEAAGDDNPDIICSGFYNCRYPHKSQVFTRRKTFKSTRRKLTATWVGKWGYVWRYLYRKRLLTDNSLYFEVGRYVEDWPVAVKALYYSNMMVSAPGAVYTYNFTPNSLLTAKDARLKARLNDDHAHAKRIIKDFAKSNGFKVPALHPGIGKTAYSLRRVYYKTLLRLGLNPMLKAAERK